MTIIEATSVSFKTMSDGSLRQTIEYSPIHAQDAFKLYGGVPGAPMGTFRLTQEAAKQSAQAETIEADKPKGGALAKLAGQWCNTESFFTWICCAYDEYMGFAGDGSGFGDIDDWQEKKHSELCRHAILVFCGIESRAELDNDDIAADRFHKLIRIPYSEYLKTL